jgi:nucleoside-diphosphate-sugar epimerase
LNLLTGATGFVGGHVVEYLFQQNEISRATFRRGSHLKILDLNGVQGLEADLLDRDSLREAIKGVDTVYSMASPMPGGDDFEKVNVQGLTNLLDATRSAGVKSVIHLSTLDVHGFVGGTVDESTPLNPVGPYQKSKARAERILMEHAKADADCKVIIIRAARVVGSRDTSLVVPLLCMIHTGRVVLPRASEMSFAHAKDVAQAMYRGASNPSLPGGVYLVKSFDATPEAFSRQLGTSVGAAFTVRSSGLLAKPNLPPYTVRQLEASVRIDAQPKWNMLGYSPEFNLVKTCDEIADWSRREPWAAEPV